jgi:SPP1 gp7 family putative phage head morphogenesis protein
LDDEQRKQTLREELKRRNRGRQMVTAKYTAKFPENAEREYLRLVNKSMAVEKQVIMKYIPRLKAILGRDTKLNTDSTDADENKKKRRTARLASLAAAAKEIEEVFDDIQREIDIGYGIYRLREELDRIANLNHRLTTDEWKKTVKKTLGIDIMEDYYSGDYYKEMLSKWVSDNVDLISTIPNSSLGRMKELVYDNYIGGATTTDIISEIQREYSVSKSHARLIARDQTAKLNSQITRAQQKEAGIDSYVWTTWHDERVRECHASFDGTTFKWDDPPEIWYSTKKGIVYTGRHCNPGEDYQCRCRAKAVINIDKVDLPT